MTNVHKASFFLHTSNERDNLCTKFTNTEQNGSKQKITQKLKEFSFQYSLINARRRKKNDKKRAMVPLLLLLLFLIKYIQKNSSLEEKRAHCLP